MKQQGIKTIDWNFKTITKPGLYGGVPLELYHSAKICDGASISSSGLRKLFNESPAHFYCEWVGNPKRVEVEDKSHFKIGRAVHHLMLGEPFFAKLFAVQPAEYEADAGEMKPWNNNAGACKSWHKLRAEEGRAVLTRNDIETIRGMAEALGRHPIVRAGALNGLIERSGFFKDKATGLWVKIRPDAIPTDSGDYTDIKTTTSVLWKDMQKTIMERGYHQQFALIRTGARELGLPFTSATLIFVEKKPPYCPRVVTIKDNTLDLGERANRMAIDAMADCLKKNHWPGPGGDREDAQNIELAEWAEKQIEDRLKYGVPT